LISYKNFKVIVIDNGSSDKSVEIIKKFSATYNDIVKQEAIKWIKSWKKEQLETGCAKTQNIKADPTLPHCYFLKERVHCGNGICVQCDESQHDACSWYNYPETKIETLQDFFNISEEDTLKEEDELK